MKKIALLIILVIAFFIFYKLNDRGKSKEAAELKLNKPLIKELNEILYQDQFLREQIDSISNTFGQESIQFKNLFKKMHDVDSVNLIKVDSVLEKYGWLGNDVIGSEGNSALFLVIQHADQKTQEKYLPIMWEAVKNGNASITDLVLLEDRVLLGQGKKQIYGSQVGTFHETGISFVFPLEDPINVDARRKKVGLPPLGEYLREWQIKWDPKQYKKDLPKLEKELLSLTQ